MRVQHNITAMNSYRNYNNNTRTINKNLEKLSSGYKINRAGDDAAGLAISEKMRAQITGLDVAQKNAKDGIGLIQTAEGALTEVHDMLNRMVYLTEQSANGTADDLDRSQLQKEVEKLSTEINRIADSANFNGIKLLDGSLGGGSASATGAVFNGANVSLAKSAELSASATLTATGASSGTGASTAVMKLKQDMSSIDTTKAGQDILRIDGKTVVIDWVNDTKAKALATTLDSDSWNTQTNADAFKDVAQQLQEVINNAAKAQGVSGSVKVTSDASGNLTIKSNSKTPTSEVSYIGNNGKDATDQALSVMNVIVNGQGAESVSRVAEVKNQFQYDGRTVAIGDSFQMTLNGTTLKVDIGTAITGGTTTLKAAAGTLETAIQAAITEYNKQIGGATGAANSSLTAGVEESKSGIVGLTTTDFKVEVGDNGNFVVKYNGNEDVNFSFSDVGTRSTASDLGLANGSSRAGGNQGLRLQIGDTADSFNQMSVSVGNIHTNAMNINGIDISTQTGAAEAMNQIKSAINYVSDIRGELGATQNRLEHTINNLSVMKENIQDAESTIRDTDVADEMMKYTKNSILVQSAQAMLAQANQQPQGVLQLLQ